MVITERPSIKGAATQTPRTAIIHAMAEYLFYEGKVRHAVEFLELIKYKYKGQPRQGLSAHILIEPSGDIIRCRRNDQGAIHAAGHNVDTLGAEWLVPGEHDIESLYATMKEPYLTDAQFAGGCEFIKKDWNEGELISRFRRHSDVDPARKQDPGEGFPFVQFLKNMGVII